MSKVFKIMQRTIRIMALNAKELKVENKALHTPPLEELAKVLNEGLKSNFAEVSVTVVNCPDLTQKPFTLVCEGLGGSPRLVEIGGIRHLRPVPQKHKLYDLKDVKPFSGLNSAFIVGAGAGPFPYVGVNCEGIINLGVFDGKVKQCSRIAKYVPDNGTYMQKILPDTETRIAMLGNLFYCEGKPGKVLEVRVRKRTGTDNFIASIRKTLAKHYGDKVVGMGGTFLLKEGKAKQHVMSDFWSVPIKTEEDRMKWLKFFNMSAPLIAVGTLVTGDPVLKVHARKRIGSDDFIGSIRKTLAKHYGDKVVGLGGTFLFKEGKAKHHVMPDFSTVPINTNDDLNKWLKFYNISAPLVAVGTLLTGDPGLSLRLQHFHSFSYHGEAGHYHIDTTPETVEYLGYFNTGEYIYRVDKPANNYRAVVPDR